MMIMHANMALYVYGHSEWTIVSFEVRRTTKCKMLMVRDDVICSGKHAVMLCPSK